MEHTRKLHTWGGFLLLLVLLVTFLIWNLLAGSVRLPASEIWAILHGGGDLTQRRILLNIRLPRLLAAMILGGALSVSGFLLQTFFHNPIAGPFVLGISSGAKFTVAVTMILLLSRGVTSSSAALSRQLSDRTTMDYTTLTWECLVPDLRNSILSDVRVREALMYAIDRTSLASTVYLGMVQESEGNKAIYEED